MNIILGFVTSCTSKWKQNCSSSTFAAGQPTKKPGWLQQKLVTLFSWSQAVVNKELSTMLFKCSENFICVVALHTAEFISPDHFYNKTLKILCMCNAGLFVCWEIQPDGEKMPGTVQFFKNAKLITSRVCVTPILCNREGHGANNFLSNGDLLTWLFEDSNGLIKDPATCGIVQHVCVSPVYTKGKTV